jgi:hypothetical protein
VAWESVERDWPRAVAGGVRPPHWAGALRSFPAAAALVRDSSDDHIEHLLDAMFAASLRGAERQSLRVAMCNDWPRERSHAWQVLRLHTSKPCSKLELQRIAPASPSERLFVAVSADASGFHIRGIARELIRGSDRAVLKLVASERGELEVAVGSERVMAVFEQGSVRTYSPPDNLLATLERARSVLLDLASDTGVAADYLDAVASLVRQLGAHGRGGILVLGAPESSVLASDTGSLMQPDRSISQLFSALEKLAEREGTEHLSAREALRAELERRIHEVGQLTSIEGATLLSRQLDVLALGALLPIVPDVTVLDAGNEAATSAFPLHRCGARHRAAASYAYTHPGSLVLVASSEGDMACMLRDSYLNSVLMWRLDSRELFETD